MNEPNEGKQSLDLMGAGEQGSNEISKIEF